MSVEQRELLMAVDDVAGIIDVERDRCRLAWVVPVGNSILLATDIESGDAPALCERFVA
jgi:hypothetical protein